jgi:hypothetical protein
MAPWYRLKVGSLLNDNQDLISPRRVGSAVTVSRENAYHALNRTVMKLAVSRPMGPLEVIDFMGLNTELSIPEIFAYSPR